jgi:hypothetical protein
MGVLVFFYFTSNLTYADKSLLLQYRSPVSASCLHHYPVAPSYCEARLFDFGRGQSGRLARLANLIEAHRLSVFASHQRWTLQGDQILSNPSLEGWLADPDQFWTEGLSQTRIPWLDYRHLNLYLDGSQIQWKVNLPSHLKEAVFDSAVAIPELKSQEFSRAGFYLRSS